MLKSRSLKNTEQLIQSMKCITKVNTNTVRTTILLLYEITKINTTRIYYISFKKESIELKESINNSKGKILGNILEYTIDGEKSEIKLITNRLLQGKKR